MDLRYKKESKLKLLIRAKFKIVKFKSKMN